MFVLDFAVYVVESTVAVCMACKCIMIECSDHRLKERLYDTVYEYAKAAKDYVIRYRLTTCNGHCVKCWRELVSDELRLTMRLKRLIENFSKINMHNEIDFWNKIQWAYDVLRHITDKTQEQWRKINSTNKSKVDIPHLINEANTWMNITEKVIRTVNILKTCSSPETGKMLTACTQQLKLNTDRFVKRVTVATEATESEFSRPILADDLEDISRDIDAVAFNCRELANHFYETRPVSSKEFVADSFFFDMITNRFRENRLEYLKSPRNIKVLTDMKKSVDIFQYVNQWLTHSLEIQRQMELEKGRNRRIRHDENVLI